MTTVMSVDSFDGLPGSYRTGSKEPVRLWSRSYTVVLRGFVPTNRVTIMLTPDFCPVGP